MQVGLMRHAVVTVYDAVWSVSAKVRVSLKTPRHGFLRNLSFFVLRSGVEGLWAIRRELRSVVSGPRRAAERGAGSLTREPPSENRPQRFSLVAYNPNLSLSPTPTLP